jgi:hypothetical protein
MADYLTILPVQTQRLHPVQSGVEVRKHDTEAEHDKTKTGVDTTPLIVNFPDAIS